MDNNVLNSQRRIFLLNKIQETDKQHELLQKRQKNNKHKVEMSKIIRNKESLPKNLVSQFCA